MNEPDRRPVVTCSGCEAALVTNARFCAHCGLPADAGDSDPVALVGSGPAPSGDADQSASVQGRAHRNGMPEWLAVLAGVAAVLSIWFVISRPSGDTEATGSSTPLGETADARAAAAVDESTVGERAVTTSSTAAPRRSTPDPAPSIAGDAPAGPLNGGSVPLADLDASGWRLLAGDGLAIVEVDLGTGDQIRHDRVGAPLAVVDDRLLLYRDSRLAWSSPFDPGQPADEIVEVPTLQRMFTRGRSADRPVVVDDGADAAIWWPNNNANPQTWTKIRLVDGTVLDAIALTETVYGGPEVVATVGSGTFERIDGRWVDVGDLFASSASRQAIVGQQCSQPDACDWVLQGRRGSAPLLERLAIPLGGPFDLRLVADADRILLLQAGGVTDHRTGRFISMVAADADTLTAVNRSRLLALADGANAGLRSSVVTLVDLDGEPDRSISRILIDDLVPRWLVLVAPEAS